MALRGGDENYANTDIKNIIASLKYGILFPKSYLLLLRFGIGTALILPALAIIMLIVTFTIGLEWDMEMIVIYTVLALAGLVLAVCYAKLIFDNNKIKVYAKLVLKDAILKKAGTKIIDIRKPILIKKELQIEIEFELNGKNVRRVSGDGVNIKTKYQKIFAQYADREIDILYSPKYDEVLILKN